MTFPGDCSEKTGKDISRWSSDYRDHLARSFETQTYVYEQAVSQGNFDYEITPRLIRSVRVDHVDLEDGRSGRLVYG